MDDSKYRFITDKNEISKLISNLADIKKGILWQSFGGQRLTYDLHRIEVIDDKIILGTQRHLRIIKNLPVFCLVHNRNLIFKLEANTFQSSENLLTAEFPLVSRSIEERKNPRFLFPPSSVSVTLKSISFNPKITEYATAQFYDISRYGFSVLWPLKQKFYFSKGNYFKIVKINDRHTNITSSFKVAHVSDSPKPKYVRVGFGGDEVFLEKFQNQIFGTF